MSVRSRLNVAIVGLGSAGQSASLFLQRMGHNVKVYEKVKNPKPVGAGFLLQPTAFVILRKLGIMHNIAENGSQVHRLWGQTTHGHSVLDLDYRLLDPNVYGLGLYRGTLFSHLLDKMEEEGVHIETGKDIINIGHVGPINSETKARQAVLTTASGETLGPFDLVVVADGARSSLRTNTHDKHSKPPNPYQWGTLWSTVPDTTGIYHKNQTLHQYFEGTAKMMGILPTGFAPANDPVFQDTTTPLVTMFWSLHRDKYESWKNRDFADWKAEVASMSSHVVPILDQLHSRDQVAFATYADVRMWPYHNPVENNVVYIGDCAHAMSPVLGQGVNLALNDAYVLAECLSRWGPLPWVLNAYSNKRRAPIRFYQWMSMLLNPWFQSSDIAGLAFARDRLFATVGKSWPFLQKEMLLTQVGAKTGFLPVKWNKGINYRFWEENPGHTIPLYDRPKKAKKSAHSHRGESQ